jgi:hypothetical protein
VIVRADCYLYHVTYQLGDLNLLTNVIQCMENRGLRIMKRSYYKTVSHIGIRINSIQCTYIISVWRKRRTYVDLCIATDANLDINELNN